MPTQLTSAIPLPEASSEPRGDVDLAAVGGLLSNPGRCRMLLALDDGRALPASRLATEAEVSPATASTHLGKLLAAGLLTVEPHGRNRYYRLAGPQVGRLLEAVAQLAPPRPIRSLREGTRAQALREARTCYDHLAGRLGVTLMASMIEAGHLTGYGHDIEYRLSPAGTAFLGDLGVRMPEGRAVLRYCVDWSEQRHHLSGATGRLLCARIAELGWIRRGQTGRVVQITDAGRRGLKDAFSIDLG